MDRAYASGASASAPTAPASPSVGYPTAGNPGSGVPATKPGPWWYHMVTEELRAVVAAAGLTPAQTDVTQLLQALPAAIASRPEMSKSHAANGYQKFPGGIIIQWGLTSTTPSGSSVTFPIAFPSSVYSIVLGQNTTAIPANAYSALNTQSLTGFAVSASSGNPGIFWFAIGK